MKRKSNYSSLDQIAPKVEDRVPLSTRVKKDTKKFLEKEAEKRDIKISALTAAILDNYVSNYKK